MFQKTKIVATIGPASSAKNVLKDLVVAGLDVCRINFSHGTHGEYEKLIADIRSLNKELGTNIAILADIQGPKIRTGEAVEGSRLKNGSSVIVTDNPCKSSDKIIFINHPGILSDIKSGDTILIDDGKIVLRAEKRASAHKIEASVLNGGQLLSNKGVNLPQTKLSLPSLTKKDRDDLEFAVKQKIDWLGLSFVRSASDIIEIKRIISPQSPFTKVIAKIEKPEAVANIDEIVAVADGLMVARGDLGVEMPMQEVPLIQKMLVKKCLAAAKPVIIATQMMESMVRNITPTRAEVNDVANSIMDGADAVMLSAETSTGKHPVKVVEYVRKIIANIENYEGIYHREYPPTLPGHPRFVSDSICYNACTLAQRVNAKAIITMTHSGYTAFKISAFRPKADIFVFTHNPAIMNTLNLLWGVKCFWYDRFVSTDQTILDLKQILKQKGMVKTGDLVINTASMPISEKGMTNMVKMSYVQ